MADEKEVKAYGLKRSETELLFFVRRQMDSVFSAVLSTIAADRLAYPVTENTSFKLSPDFKSLEIAEVSPTEVSGETTPDSEPIKEAK